MAKPKLNSLLNSLHGKIDKHDSICFRKTPAGGNSVYVQQEHSHESLHSPAQERHRQLMGQASSNASLILSDPSQLETYRLLYNASNGKYSSLRYFIIHLEYERLKEVSQGMA